MLPQRNPETGPAWHATKAELVVQNFSSSSINGLDHAEADKRIQQYGPNSLQGTSRYSWLKVLSRQFLDSLIVILLVAAAISIVIGELVDAITILLIVVLNGIFGFVQEWKAERAIQALQHMLQPVCRVIRAGSEETIDANKLVPGDLVLIDVGDHIPADLRLLSAASLKIEESALTGESAAVEKDTIPIAAATALAERKCMAWMGTAVANGRGRGLVTATGMNTELGRIAALTSTVGREMTPLQEKLATLGKQLGLAAIIISIAVAAYGWLAGQPRFDMFMTGISLAVAIVPEGLPVVVTLTLAFGVREMVSHQALLRRLQAAETLGAATVICTDKTGTLTHNEMTVQTIWQSSGSIAVSGIGYEPEGSFSRGTTTIDIREHPDLADLLHSGMLCNNANLRPKPEGWVHFGDPTEIALLVAAAKGGLTKPDQADSATQFSFNANRKRMTVIEADANGCVAHVKGAPEIILERSSHLRVNGQDTPLSDASRLTVANAYQAMAEQGLRVLAIARRQLPEAQHTDADEVEQQLTFLGLVGILDPPREQVAEAISLARRAGIRSIMVTGDAPATAIAIARSIGLPVTRAIHGSQLQAMSEDELREAVQEDVLFARTAPEDKLRIVCALQELGHVVGMTGDGVNDAPALKRADIGIAMGVHGTDVARAASDMVLMDDNFSSIILAVNEGRRQYANIQKFVQYLLSSNSGEVIAIFANLIIGGPLILLPVQILWMNLITDGMTAVSLGVEPAEKELMRQRPRPASASILDRGALLRILLLGGYIGLATLFMFNYYLGGSEPSRLLHAQTMAFTTIIICEKMNVFNFRSLQSPLSVIGFFTNRWVLLAWGGTILLQVAAVYVPFLQRLLHTMPLNGRDWLAIFAISLPVFLISEGVKHYRRRLLPEQT